LKKSPELLSELFVASHTSPFSEWALDMVKVMELRQRLEEKNLDVDGTREMLIQRLKDELDNCLIDSGYSTPK
jgi:hypothetical protein